MHFLGVVHSNHWKLDLFMGFDIAEHYSSLYFSHRKNVIYSLSFALAVIWSRGSAFGSGGLQRERWEKRKGLVWIRQNCGLKDRLLHQHMYGYDDVKLVKWHIIQSMHTAQLWTTTRPTTRCFCIALCLQTCPATLLNLIVSSYPMQELRCHEFMMVRNLVQILINNFNGIRKNSLQGARQNSIEQKHQQDLTNRYRCLRLAFPLSHLKLHLSKCLIWGKKVELHSIKWH